MQLRSRILKQRCCGDAIWVIRLWVSNLFLLSLLSFSSGSPQISVPTIGSDNLVYACANTEVLAFWGNGTLAWRASMNQTCQTEVAPVIDYEGKVYVAADQTVVVATPPSSQAAKPSAANFFSLVPAQSLKSIGNFLSVQGLAVTSWSSVLYVNTGTGVHAFMLDGTPLWSTLVQFNNSMMKSPASLGPCTHNMTNCTFLPPLIVDQCDGSIYVARSDGWLFSYASWQPFLRWTFDFGADVPLTLKLVSGNNGRIYATRAVYDTVYALSAQLGTLVWQAKVGPLSESCSPVVDLLGYVSVGSLDGFLYVISPDGTLINKYLAADSSSQVTIQIAPVLDCSSEALYVAQTRVASKTVQQIDGVNTVSVMDLMGLRLWMFSPSSGQILWSTLYPELFPTEILTQDLSLYDAKPVWILALTAVANLSRQSLCQTQQLLLKTSCSMFVFRSTKVYHSGNMKALVAFSASILVIFLLLSLLSILMYYSWRRRQIWHRHRFRRFLKLHRFCHPQGLLLKRRKIYEQNIEYLRAELELEPQAPKVLEQLRIALEGRHFIEQYLAAFPSDTLLSDHFYEEWLLTETARVVQGRCEERGKGFLSTVFHNFFTGPEDEDFTEEMQMLSLYNDDGIPVDPFMAEELSVQVGMRPSLSVSESSSVEVSGECYGEPVVGQSSTGEFSNPLFDDCRTVAPSPLDMQSITVAPKPAQKTVSFSPLNEVFDESDEHASDNLGASSELELVLDLTAERLDASSG